MKNASEKTVPGEDEGGKKKKPTERECDSKCYLKVLLKWTERAEIYNSQVYLTNTKTVKQ